jgi:hypothetical protein
MILDAVEQAGGKIINRSIPLCRESLSDRRAFITWPLIRANNQK